MKQESDLQKLNTDQIEMHLKSAVGALTPHVLDRIDLSAPQEAVPPQETQARAAILRMERRMRGFAAAAAACLCVVMMGGGAFHYHVQNGRVESVIGIDVNPSVELSINRKERVLSAEALNEDARAVMEDMDLKGVDLNVAVNAVVGSMVTHGYLDDLDNAILVTVSNDSVRKARQLRASVVQDIEQTLEENQLHAVVYDQQVIEDDGMKQLAERYGISYGKAYFLSELIAQNDSLTMDDMEEMSAMTMEEIAKKIAEQSFALGELADKVAETSAPASAETEPETEASSEAPSEPETESEAPSPAPESSGERDVRATEAASAETAAERETEEEIEDGLIDIDYVDFEDDILYVYFVTRVKWKNPTVAVRDEEGNSYAAMVEDTSRDECSIEISGLEGGRSYTFVLGGLSPVEGGGATTVKGYFEKPEIAAEATETADDGEDETDVTGDDESGENEIWESRPGENKPGENRPGESSRGENESREQADGDDPSDDGISEEDQKGAGTEDSDAAAGEEPDGDGTDSHGMEAKNEISA